MVNHTQYSGFAGVDLAKKSCRFTLSPETEKSLTNKSKELSFSISSETGVNALLGWKPAVLLRTGLESLKPWGMKCI